MSLQTAEMFLCGIKMIQLRGSELLHYNTSVAGDFVYYVAQKHFGCEGYRKKVWFTISFSNTPIKSIAHHNV
jgi:hypothetical protein